MKGVVARRFIALATARRPIAAALMQAAVRGSLMTTQHRACKLAAIKIQAVARHFTYQQQQADIKRMQMAVLMQAAARSRVASSAIDVKKSAAFFTQAAAQCRISLASFRAHKETKANQRFV